jgi:ATP-dependent protease HslVU (ClpYQ) ATPase subunit
MIVDKLSMGAGAIVGAVLMFAPAYFIGRHDAKQASATVALENSVRVLRKRNQINDEVSASDAAALCGSYGMSVDDEAECVRRVREAAAEPGNDGDDPQDGSTVR